jgi:GDP-L-fucose synthase
MAVVIAGSTGLVGSALTDAFVAAGHEVIGLNRSKVNLLDLAALIRRFVEATENGSDKVTLWGSGSPKREFLHVHDLARAVLITSENYDSSMHLNIGSGSDLTIEDLAKKVATAAGFTGGIEWDISKPDGTPQKVLDVSRIKALGWEPTITLEEGIASTIAWYKEANVRGEVRK